MKPLHKIFIPIIVLCTTLFFTGCQDFDDINTNPDDPTKASASMLCTDVILSITKFNGRDAKSLITENALPKYIGYANEGQLSTQYNLIGAGSFSLMTTLMDIKMMEENAKGNTAESSYQGVAKFARAYIFYLLTMEMGDIPYNEASQGEQGNFTPKYDSQQTIFLGILDELKEADSYFSNNISFAGDPTPYNGNAAQWRKAANTLSLKILMMLSKKAGDPSLEIQSRFLEIITANNLMESTADFYGLEYSTQNKHPLSGTNDLFTSRTILSSLLVDNLKLYNDKRLLYFGEPVDALGLPASDLNAYIGVDVSMDYSQLNSGYSNGEYSILNKRYLEEDACEPRRLLSYAEQQLIIAEAILKNWIAGDAQQYYESGVQSALEIFLEANSTYAHGDPIDITYISNYFTGEAAFKANMDEQLQQIWMQRYFLNFMQDAETTYFEYRRTNYPAFPINPDTSLNENNKNAIPMRWTYPSSEYNYNRGNMEEALDRQYDGYDEINKLMWLLK